MIARIKQLIFNLLVKDFGRRKTSINYAKFYQNYFLLSFHRGKVLDDTFLIISDYPAISLNKNVLLHLQFIIEDFRYILIARIFINYFIGLHKRHYLEVLINFVLQYNDNNKNTTRPKESKAYIFHSKCFIRG